MEGLGEKKAGDLIADERFEYDGQTIRVYGSLKNLKEAWAEFDSTGNNTGHFIPLTLPAECKGKQVTLKGKAQDATITIDDDRLLVQRLENLTGTTLTVQMEGKTICIFDFTPLIPRGAKAHDTRKTDFGRFGKMELLTENLTIDWLGYKGTAKGTLKYFKGGKEAGAEKLTDPGNYFPLALADFFDGVNKSFKIKNDKSGTEKDIIFKVTDTNDPIKITYQGLPIMEIDLSGLTLEPASEDDGA